MINMSEILFFFIVPVVILILGLSINDMVQGECPICNHPLRGGCNQCPYCGQPIRWL